MKSPRIIAICLLVSAVALAAGGFLTRYLLSTPDPDYFGPPFAEWYPIPTDPRGLAHKWFYAALVVGAVGGWLWFRSRGRTGAPKIVCAALLAGFWPALVCAVEFSRPEWAAVGWSEARAKVTPEMMSDPHFLLFDSRSGSDSVHVIRLVPRELHTSMFMIMAGSGTREAREPAREGLQAEDRRWTYAAIGWTGAVVLAAGFVFVARRRPTS